MAVIQVITIAIGFVFIVVGALSFSFIDVIIRAEIIKKVLLVNGTQGYKLWQNPPIPIYLQIYVFDLVNQEEVESGGKPNVTQRGPYTYRERRIKVDIQHNDNGTVSYRQIKTYHFVYEMSVGWDNETFTTVNVPYMTLVDGIRTKGWLTQLLISRLIKYVFPSEGVFLTRTVQEIVWGYTDPILHAAKTYDKETFDQDFIGILQGMNDTDDGLYTVFTGERNISLLGVIDKFNGASHLNYWSSDEANMINGTDGTVAPPFITKSLIAGSFSTDICRSIYATYHGTVKTLNDISLYRFTSPPAAMASAHVNPANAGFCTPPGNCVGSGLLNMSTCKIKNQVFGNAMNYGYYYNKISRKFVDTFHVPIIASAPHFYMADAKYQNAIYNMHPNAEEHATNIDIEPNTGMVMQAQKKLQINVFLNPSYHFEKTAKLRTLVFPVLWLNESAMTDKAHADQLTNQLLTPKAVLSVGKYVVTILGACVVLTVCSVVVLRSFLKTSKMIQKLPSEDPDLQEDSAIIINDPSSSPSRFSLPREPLVS